MDTIKIISIILMAVGLLFAIISAINSTFNHKKDSKKQKIPLGFFVNDNSFWYWFIVVLIGFILWRFL